MTIETLKNLLRHYGLSPNKTYGQHFLMDETILEDMIDQAGVKAGDTVIEIGPGIGNLTERLLQRGANLLSLEKDEQFLPVLKTLKKEHDNFDYELVDALKFNFSAFLSSLDSERSQENRGSIDSAVDSRSHPVSSSAMTRPYKVVANIPYYITGKIVQLFLQQEQKPQSLTLLMQKEVAQNIVAKPGHLNLLAISVQLHGEAELTTIVPGHKFYPAPKVDSAVIHISLFDKPRYELEDEKKFFQILRACFAGKRKQIHNTLVNNLDLLKDEVAEILAAVKVLPSARPQELTIEQWIALVDKIELQK